MSKYKSELSENIVIGSLINNVNLILYMKDLKDYYFTIKVNRMLYLVIKKLFKSGSESIDIADIYAIVETNESYLKMLEEAGGLEYLEVLLSMGEDKTIDDIKPHIENIRQASFKNELEDLLTSMKINLDNSGSKPINSIYKEVEENMLELKSSYSTTDGLKLIGEDIDSLVEKLETQSQSGHSGFPFSIPLLNKFVTLERGELVVISGGTKSGKSLLTTHEVAYLCVKNKVPTLVLDSELSTKTFLTRLIASLTGYKINYIKNCEYLNNQVAHNKVKQAIQDIKDSKLIHKYIVGISESELLNEIKRVKLQHNICLVVYDYIKADTITNADQQERLQLSHITNFLKNDVCGDLNLAGLALCQTSIFNDGSGNKYKTFGSSGIIMYSSCTIYLVKKTQNEIDEDFGVEMGGNYKLFINFNRNGSQMIDDTQAINIVFDNARCSITQAQYQPQSLLDMIKEIDETS